MKNNSICALDLGSSKASAMVCVFNRQGKIIDMTMESVSSKGIKAGHIVNFSELSASVETLLNKLQKSSKLKIKELYTNVSGSEVTTRHSRAIMPLAERGNKVITDADLYRIREEARVLGTSLQDEIIHQIPFGYIVDGDNFCLNPRELYAHRLEVDLYLIYAKLSYIQGITRLLHQLGYSIKAVFYSGFTSAKLALGQGKRYGIDIFCDIGADLTDLVMFKDKILQKIEVLTRGADDITVAISRNLNIPFELAEEIKRRSAVVGEQEDLSLDKEVMVNKDNAYVPIKQREISQIATQSCSSMCMAIKEAVNKMAEGGTVNSLFIAGRSAIQEGLLEKLEELSGIPTKLVRIPAHMFLNNDIHNELASSYIKTLTYLNSFALIVFAWESAQENNIFRNAPSLKSLSGIANKVKQVYQQYF